MAIITVIAKPAAMKKFMVDNRGTLPVKLEKDRELHLMDGGAKLYYRGFDRWGISGYDPHGKDALAGVSQLFKAGVLG